jgi:hypothetical protein
MRIALATAASLRGRGHEMHIIHPQECLTVACPSYPEIRLAVWPHRHLNGVRPEGLEFACDIATEGAVGDGGAPLLPPARAGAASSRFLGGLAPIRVAPRATLPLGRSSAMIGRIGARRAQRQTGEAN